MKTIKLKEQYLTLKNPNTRIVAIKSPKGSGKTRWLQDNLSDVPALFISHRVALVRDIAQRNKTANYKDGSSAYRSPRLTICLDSLPALFHSDVHQGSTVVIDEATQVLRHLCGDTLRGKRKEVLTTLQRKLYHAKQVILLDADLDSLTLNYFASLMDISPDSDEITWVENVWNPKNKTFIEFPTKEALLLDLMVSVKAGLNCYVASDSKNIVKEVSLFLKSKVEGIKLLAVHGDNSSQDTESDFIANVNERQLEYQVVAASPSLATGVDINQPHFDKVYLFANRAGSTSKDLLQSAARVRTINEINFWVTSSVFSEEESWEKILEAKERVAFGEGWLGNVDYELRQSRGGDVWAWDYNPKADKVVLKDSTFMTMFCKLQAAHNADLNDLHSSFIEAAEKEGKVTQAKVSEVHTKVAEAVKKETKELRQQMKEAEQAAILNASDLTEDQYTVMNLVSESLSPEETNSLKKYKLLDTVGFLSEHLPYAVEHEKTIFKSVYLLGLLAKSDEELAKQDEHDLRTKNPIDRKQRVKTKNLINEFLTNINYWNSINHGEELREYFGDGRFGMYTPFSSWAIDNKAEIKELLGVTVTKDVEQKPFQIIQAILNVLGLGAKQGKRRSLKIADVMKLNPINNMYQLPFADEVEKMGSNASVRVRTYHADQESNTRMFAILKAREVRLEQKKERELAEMPF